MSKPRPDLWRVGIVTPLKYLDAFETALEPFAESLSSFLADPDADEREEDVLWRLEGHSRTPPDRTALTAALAVTAAVLDCPEPEPDFARIADTDWVSANMRSFPPIEAGRFFVHGSHFEGTVPGGHIGLLVNAGPAFGSGEHATTFGCLLAIDRLLRRRRFFRPLDLGCGSGILGIALAKAGRGTHVIAADIDPLAVHVAAGNARLNQVRSRTSFLVSTGYDARAIGRAAPYDLIMANILAIPLRAMAADLGRHLAPGGMAVLSGLLNRQERMVLAAHRLQGLVLTGRIRRQGWSTLILSKPGDTAQRLRALPMPKRRPI